MEIIRAGDFAVLTYINVIALLGRGFLALSAKNIGCNAGSAAVLRAVS